MYLPPLQQGHYTVFLEDLRRHVKLGVLDHEVRPQLVSFSIAAIIKRLGPGDGIEDVVDYDHLRQAVITLTEDTHFGLQETLCEALIEEIGRHKGVHGVVAETRKLSVYPDAEAVGCRMERIEEGVLR
ncbi:dihydroneopterin aldolase [Parvularcula maris]|uniref:Dihydroneopterin aldolase n=1 Tax=Parvularcula maris TaxID=2965077 RepID=A0A9X2L7X8_9PROT|nr:dihydroneopterin aldolase [Parvularcula maris]